MAWSADEWFGLQVKEYREVKGWSMSELAKRLSEAGLTNFYPTTVGRLERGERPVRLSEAVVFAEVLGTSLDNLVIEPLHGDEDLTYAVEHLPGETKRAAQAMARVWLSQENVRSLLKATRAALASSEIRPEYMDEVEESCQRAEVFLQESGDEQATIDRIMLLAQELAVMTDDERRALYKSDPDYSSRW